MTFEYETRKTAKATEDHSPDHDDRDWSSSGVDGVANEWWQDPVSGEDFLFKFGKLGREGFLGHITATATVELVRSTHPDPVVDDMLLHAHRAAVEMWRVRRGDPGASAVAAYQQWSSARPFVDRVAAHAGPAARRYTDEIAYIDRRFSELLVTTEVGNAIATTGFAGHDALLLAHKDLIIKAVEQARETSNQLLAAAQSSRQSIAEVGKTVQKGAEHANKLVEPERGVADLAPRADPVAAPASSTIPTRASALDALDAALLVLKADDVGAALAAAKGPLAEVKAIGSLFEYAVDVATSVVTLTLDSVAVLVARSMPNASTQLGGLAAKIKESKGKWMGRAMTLFNVITSTADLIAALRSGDEEAAVRAGGSIAGALAGFAAQQIKMGGVYGAFLTMYIQELTEGIVAIGHMGAALKQAGVDRAVGDVGAIANQGVALAKGAAALEVAWRSELAGGPLARDAGHERVSAIAAIHAHARTAAGLIANLGLSRERGGVRGGAQLVAAVGKGAQERLVSIQGEADPFKVISACTDVILPGLQELVGKTLASEGTMSEERLAHGGLEQIAG